MTAIKHLSEVARMVLVEVDPVMMLTTSVTTTSRMLPVLSNPSVAVRDVASQLPSLLLACGHPYQRSPLKRVKTQLSELPIHEVI